MKRLIFMLLVVAMLLFGCTQVDKKDDSTDSIGDGNQMEKVTEPGEPSEPADVPADIEDMDSEEYDVDFGEDVI
ncbi:hypothetical protein H6503_06025 [Candidatus Woesearchaeota archaeon]|nr:hypothetical protein [Candidatus Woesearchaeota archaeon]